MGGLRQVEKEMDGGGEGKNGWRKKGGKKKEKKRGKKEERQMTVNVCQGIT